jgi:hypothetical protein
MFWACPRCRSIGSAHKAIDIGSRHSAHGPIRHHTLTIQGGYGLLVPRMPTTAHAWVYEIFITMLT